MEYNGIPYLAPIAPLDIEAQKNALIKVSTAKIFKRPIYLSKKNPTKMRRKDES
jgi:hypothetical protein